MQLTTKFSVALLGALAASSDAYSQNVRARHDRMFHPRRATGTPTRLTSTSYVTILPTPLYPSSSAAASSSAAVNPVVSPSSSPSIPLTTGVPGNPSGSATETAGGDVTVTYTLGTGTTQIVVTTTIHKTSTETETVWETPSSAPVEDSTSTVYSDATSTYTVIPVPSSSGGSEGGCGSPVTVTVTDTVTVTAVPTAAPTTSAGSGDYEVPDFETHNGGNTQTTTIPEHATHTKHPHHPGHGHGDGEGDGEAPYPTAVPTLPPNNNGTAPTRPGAAQPTGFLTSRAAFPTNFRRHYV